MPMSSNMREYIAQGNANPGPNDKYAPGGEKTQLNWSIYDNGWGPHNPSPSFKRLPSLKLVTWNVDGWAKDADQRISAILADIRTHNPDVILLQELNAKTTTALLSNQWIRDSFYTSNASPEPENSGVPIVQITFVSRTLDVGEVWSQTLPSRYERNLVISDVGGVRLINVHFDSLAHDPSFRPEQVQIASELIKEAGAGVIAGDWNPVMEIDHSLVQQNGLVDAWNEVGSGPGFTWNWDGRSKEPFPPQRLDKVAVFGMRAREISVLEPGTLQSGE